MYKKIFINLWIIQISVLIVEITLTTANLSPYLMNVMFINWYHNIFDSKISEFVTADLLKGDSEEKFIDKLSKLDKEDRFYEIKLQTLKSERLSQLESAEKFEQQKKKAKKGQN